SVDADADAVPPRDRWPSGDAAETVGAAAAGTQVTAWNNETERASSGRSSGLCRMPLLSPRNSPEDGTRGSRRATRPHVPHLPKGCGQSATARTDSGAKVSATSAIKGPAGKERTPSARKWTTVGRASTVRASAAGNNGRSRAVARRPAPAS